MTEPVAAPTSGPSLSRREPEGAPRGVVLMLHGGAVHGVGPVTGRSGSYQRMRYLAGALRDPLLEAGLAVWLLRFAVRGWNAERSAGPSPVPDARWALAQAHEAHPGVPVTLLGHSMGARTAAYVADDEAVTGMVGLAPWFERGDPVEQLRGRQVTALHGSRDRITSARHTRAYLRRAEEAGASTAFVDMGLLGHYMLARPKRWNAAALEATLGVAALAT